MTTAQLPHCEGKYLVLLAGARHDILLIALIRPPTQGGHAVFDRPGQDLHIGVSDPCIQLPTKILMWLM